MLNGGELAKEMALENKEPTYLFKSLVLFFTVNLNQIFSTSLKMTNFSC